MCKKVIRYSDELNDDFAGNNITRQSLGDHFVYTHKGKLWNLCAKVLYNAVTPIAFIVQKVYSRQSFRNKKVLKVNKKNGFYVYSNHTSVINDAFVLPLICPFKKKGYVVCNPDATSIHGLRNIVQMLGAVPLGENMKQNISMINCMNGRIKNKQIMVIYPEAHIWPYYNGIRNFSYVSFKYPLKTDTPVYALTHCYQRRLFSYKPKIVSYFDGPFYPDTSLSTNDAALKLRNEVYDAMKRRTDKYSTYEYYKYIKTESEYASEDSKTVNV